MTEYSVTRKSDGAEVFRYWADAPIEWVGFEFATHTHTALPAVGVSPPVLEPISKYAFRERFTNAERLAIELAALDVPDGSFAAREAAAQVRVWMADIEAAAFVDLMLDKTRAGVQALENYGLIAAGRAAVILDTPPTADEVYRG